MRNATPKDEAVYTLRVDRTKLDQLRQIADAEHRTLVQKIRVLIENEIAAHQAAA